MTDFMIVLVIRGVPRKAAATDRRVAEQAMRRVTISAQNQVLAASGGGHRAARFLERSTTIGRMGASAVRAGTIDRAGFRPELNGLRGLAIALVVVASIVAGMIVGCIAVVALKTVAANKKDAAEIAAEQQAAAV